MEHTEGPWIQSPACESAVVAPNGTPDPERDVDYYGGAIICESVSECDVPLICAAPDLLEACKKAERVLIDGDQDAESPADNAAWNRASIDCIKALREAIRKAEGT